MWGQGQAFSTCTSQHFSGQSLASDGDRPQEQGQIRPVAWFCSHGRELTLAPQASTLGRGWCSCVFLGTPRDGLLGNTLASLCRAFLPAARAWPAAGALLVGCASPSPSTLAPARGPLRASFSEETDPRPSKFLQPPGPISSCPGRHSLSLAGMVGKLLCSVAGMSLGWALLYPVVGACSSPVSAAATFLV